MNIDGFFLLLMIKYAGVPVHQVVIAMKRKCDAVLRLEFEI